MRGIVSAQMINNILKICEHPGIKGFLSRFELMRYTLYPHMIIFHNLILYVTLNHVIMGVVPIQKLMRLQTIHTLYL